MVLTTNSNRHTSTRTFPKKAIGLDSWRTAGEQSKTQHNGRCKRLVGEGKEQGTWRGTEKQKGGNEGRKVCVQWR